MPTTYTDISYDSTTQTEVLAGYVIMCDNTDIYCNSEEYYCDGSVVHRPGFEYQPEIKCNDTTVKANDRWTILISSNLVYTEISYP